MTGLIDTDYQRIRIRLRDKRRAHAGAAERIDNQRSVVTLQLLEQMLECFSGMRGAGFAPGVILVMSHNLCEVRMGSDLVCLKHWCSMGTLICLRSVNHLAIIPRHLSLSGQY